MKLEIVTADCDCGVASMLVGVPEAFDDERRAARRFLELQQRGWAADQRERRGGDLASNAERYFVVHVRGRHIIAVRGR
ncbi:MAG TPA: hypothetical protein VF183_03500 [Acidimicrobiales bacterium]